MLKRIFLVLLVTFTQLEAKQKILVGSPVRQKPAILREFLASLERMDTSQLQIDYFFIDDNELQESSGLLWEFSQKNENCQVLTTNVDFDFPYICDEETHNWTPPLVDRVIEFEDILLDFARENEYDCCFLVDSDLVLDPRTLNHLIKADKEIITTIYWTQSHPHNRNLPNVWLKDDFVLSDSSLSEEEFFTQLQTPGTYEIGGISGCFLISRSAMDKGVRFAFLPNLSFYGRDRHFAVRANALDIPLYVDTQYPALHLYRMSDLEKLIPFLKNPNLVNVFSEKPLGFFQNELEKLGFLVASAPQVKKKPR